MEMQKVGGETDGSQTSELCAIISLECPIGPM